MKRLFFQKRRRRKMINHHDGQVTLDNTNSRLRECPRIAKFDHIFMYYGSKSFT